MVIATKLTERATSPVDEFKMKQRGEVPLSDGVCSEEPSSSPATKDPNLEASHRVNSLNELVLNPSSAVSTQPEALRNEEDSYVWHRQSAIDVLDEGIADIFSRLEQLKLLHDPGKKSEEEDTDSKKKASKTESTNPAPRDAGVSLSHQNLLLVLPKKPGSTLFEFDDGMQQLLDYDSFQRIVRSTDSYDSCSEDVEDSIGVHRRRIASKKENTKIRTNKNVNSLPPQRRLLQQQNEYTPCDE